MRKIILTGSSSFRRVASKRKTSTLCVKYIVLCEGITHSWQNLCISPVYSSTRTTYVNKLTSRTLRSLTRQRDCDGDSQLFTAPTYRILNFISRTYVRKLWYSSQSRNWGTEWKTKESWFYSRQRQGLNLFFKASRPAVGSIKPPMKLTRVIFRGKATGAWGWTSTSI